MSNISGNYVLDPAHTRIGFWVRHAMVTKVRGEFTQYDAKLTVDEQTPANSIATAVIQAASINTSNEDRDNHVKGADFFDVENFPEITFTSTKFDIAGTEGKVTGDLTIKGTTRPVVLDVEIFGLAEDPFGNTRLGFEAKTKINRKDFGIDFNAPLNTGGALVSEDINIEIEGSAIRQGDAQA